METILDRLELTERIGLPYLYGTRHEGEGDRRDPEREDQPEAACGYPG